MLIRNTQYRDTAFPQRSRAWRLSGIPHIWRNRNGRYSAIAGGVKDELIVSYGHTTARAAARELARRYVEYGGRKPYPEWVTLSL